MQDTFDVNGNGSTEDYVCYATANFNVATTPAMSIAKEVKGNKNPDFVPAGEVAEIDPGADGAYRFTISNAGNTPLTKVVATTSCLTWVTWVLAPPPRRLVTLVGSRT